MERRVYMGSTPDAPRPLRGPHQKPAWTKQYLVDQGGAWDTIHELGSYDNVARRLEHVSPDVALGYMDEDERKHVLGAVVDLCQEYNLWGYLLETSGVADRITDYVYQKININIPEEIEGIDMSEDVALRTVRQYMTNITSRLESLGNNDNVADRFYLKIFGEIDAAKKGTDALAGGSMVVRGRSHHPHAVESLSQLAAQPSETI